MSLLQGSNPHGAPFAADNNVVEIPVRIAQTRTRKNR
jgi:hypothetical protein